MAHATPPATHRPGRALITGATGYIGSNLSRRLISDGWSVCGLSRSARRHRVTDPAGVTMYRNDGTYASIRTAVADSRPDVVFHLAAAVIAQPTAGEIDQLIASNLALVTQLTEAMNGVGCGCLVNTGSYWQFAADGSLRPRTLYAATKAAASAIVDFNVVRGLRAATLILYDVYGPNDSRPKLLNSLAALNPSSAPVELTSGNQVMDYIYIDDVLDAYIAAARHLLAYPGPAHDQFVVRGFQPCSLRAVVGELESVLGFALPIAWDAKPHQDHDIMQPWLGDTRVPGWSPRVLLREGLRRMLQRA